MDLKSKLLELDLVENNEFLDKYIGLISNSAVDEQKYKTHKHHIIPRFYYADNNLEVDNSADNLVNLYVKDHLLAHYYLFRCGKGAFKAKNISCLSFFFDKLNINNEEDFISACNEYQNIYEEFIIEQSKICSKRFKGVKQNPEVIQNRVNKNIGKKRSAETRVKMGAWQKGKPKSEKARQNMSIAQKKYASTESEEHKSIRIAKYKETCSQRTPEQRALIGLKHKLATKGRVVSEEERRKKSVALKGKKKSSQHTLNNARAHSKYNYIINDTIFLSRKEAVDFLLSLNINFTQNEIVNLLSRKDEKSINELVDGEKVLSFEKEEKSRTSVDDISLKRSK